MEDPEKFESFTDELSYNLTQAERYARRAHDMLYTTGGRRRSFFFTSAVGRAQSILMTLSNQERARRKEEGGVGWDNTDSRKE